MSLTSKIASFAGDIWISWKCVGLWPWPAVIVGRAESKTTGQDYREMSNRIKPGDMILERGDLFRLSNRGIPESLTYLKHLAVYVGAVDGVRLEEFITSPKPGNQYKKCIIHAISEGVVCQDILDLFKHSDEIVVVRPWKSTHEQNKIIDEAFNNVGRSYDFSFKSNNEDLYCTELGAKCIQAAGIALPKTVRTRNSLLGLFFPFDRFKGNVYVADSFVKMYQIIFKSESVR